MKIKNYRVKLPNFLLATSLTKKRIKIKCWYQPPSFNSPELWAVSPSALRTTHWYSPRSSLETLDIIKVSPLGLPGNTLPFLYHERRCKPEPWNTGTEHRNSAIAPILTVCTDGITSTCKGVLTMSWTSAFASPPLLLAVHLYIPESSGEMASIARTVPKTLVRGPGRTNTASVPCWIWYHL